MDSPHSLTALIFTAASLGFAHTIVGPGHYLPFASLAKFGNWSYFRTMCAVFACGFAHVLSSLVIGAVGLALGAGVGALERVEGSRADIVKWAFLAFAVAYFAFGLRSALRGGAGSRRPEAGGGAGESSNSCGAGGRQATCGAGAKRGERATFWLLFAVFAFGPCEVLIPLVMYPAASFDWLGVLAVAVAFSAATLLTMLAAVSALYFGLRGVNAGGLERWGNAITGLVFLACAVFMLLGERAHVV